MVLTKISIFIFLFCGIKFSVSQDDAYLTQPWVDTVLSPEPAPVILAINSSCATPVANTFNRFISTYPEEPLVMYNTGKYVYAYVPASADSLSICYTMGGALGLDEYKFRSALFLWDLNLGNAGITVDGVGSPMQVVAFHSNLDYTTQNASNHLDGWYLQIHRVKIVDGAPYSDNFAEFGQKISQITMPGTSVNLTRADLNWFNPSAFRVQEYCYPGFYFQSKNKPSN